MKEKRSDTMVVLLTLMLLLAAGLFALLWPQNDFSESERRYRSDAPSAPALSAWKTDKEIESYLSDRIPFRQILVGMDSAVQAYTGRRTQLAAWPVESSLIEPPVEGDPDVLQRRLNQFQNLADQAHTTWQLLVPPTHGRLLRNRMNPLMQALFGQEDQLTALLEQNTHVIPLTDEFLSAPDEVYYHTDHHWTLAGAWIAYARFCELNGRTVYPLSTLKTENFPGFTGTTATRSGFFWRQPDILNCAEPQSETTLIISGEDKVYSRLIFPEAAASWDGYSVYLNGNHGRLEIGNADAPSGTLLVFKDSFANCLLPLLAADFQRVVAVDARYVENTFSEIIADVRPDQLLFCYSLDSLVNDTMLARKAK